MIDLKVFWGFAFRQTDRRTFGVVESLSRLKTDKLNWTFTYRNWRKNKNPKYGDLCQNMMNGTGIGVDLNRYKNFSTS